jgi:hypothetical protein
MTEQQFIYKVEAIARRLEVQPPRIRIAPSKGRDALRVRLSGWTLRTTPRALAELSEAEMDFGLAVAFMARLEPDQRKPHWVISPFLATTFIGVCVLSFGRDSFLDQFWLGFGVLFGLMVLGYIAGMFVSLAVDERARQRVLGEALNITGNASAAETYLIRCKTDHLLFGRRRLASTDRDQLDQQLDALRAAAAKLGLSYIPVGLTD